MTLVQGTVHIIPKRPQAPPSQDLLSQANNTSFTIIMLHVVPGSVQSLGNRQMNPKPKWPQMASRRRGRKRKGPTVTQVLLPFSTVVYRTGFDIAKSISLGSVFCTGKCMLDGFNHGSHISALFLFDNNFSSASLCVSPLSQNSYVASKITISYLGTLYPTAASLGAS